MEWLNIVAMVSVLSGIVFALFVAADLYRHKQPMKIMNSVWVLTALWGGVVGLCAYFLMGRTRKRQKTSNNAGDGVQPMKMDAAMDGMRMEGKVAVQPHDMDGMIMGAMRSSDVGGMQMEDKGVVVKSHDMGTMKMNGMNGMEMKSSAPGFRSVALSTLHCGAGCTLADITGEWFLWFVPIAIGGSLLIGEWIFVYILALCIGVFFQYSAIREMSDVKPAVAVKRAFKADFFSLTAWQVGMYGWVAVMTFMIFPDNVPERITWTYWFMMQIAMGVGFCIALPVNYLLIRSGVKKAM